MQAVLKYPLEIKSGIQRIKVPRGAQLLDVQMQRGVPCLWALSFGGADTEERLFRMAGTGWALPAEQLRFIATVQDGDLVWHFFEVMP